MSNGLPVWFQADHVFSHAGRWYLGKVGSLHIGPYGDRATARSKSDQITDELRSLADDSSKLAYVRRLLRVEWREVREGIPEQSADSQEPPVPVRAGETHRRWFRSDRIFSVGMAWFIATREGIDIGPFNSRKEAKRREKHVVHFLTEAESLDAVYRLAYEYKHRPSMLGNPVQ